MYRISKDKGYNQNITLINTETKASVALGTLTMSIMRILEKEVEFDETKEHAIKLTDKWDFAISYESAKDLATIASPIKKPVRVKKEPDSTISEQVEQQPIEIQLAPHTKSGREVVDVYDLIFGA